MREKVLYRRSYLLYDCSLDPKHPCWGGRDHGVGSCGNGVIWEVTERNNRYIVLRREYEYNTHSVNVNDHIYNQTSPEEIAEYNSLEEAIEYIKFIRECEEFKPEEKRERPAGSQHIEDYLSQFSFNTETKVKVMRCLELPEETADAYVYPLVEFHHENFVIDHYVNNFCRLKTDKGHIVEIKYYGDDGIGEFDIKILKEEYSETQNLRSPAISSLTS